MCNRILRKQDTIVYAAGQTWLKSLSFGDFTAKRGKESVCPNADRHLVSHIVDELLCSVFPSHFFCKVMLLFYALKSLYSP